MIPGLNYAVSGLSANQRALEVTGHNVSNLGTAGFARQGVIMATALPHVYGNWKVEMGVSIQQIRQIRHLFLDNIYRVETNAQGYWEARSTALNDLQAILAEPMAEGLQSALNRFWDGWQELSKAPESLTIRALLKQRADALVDCINHIGAQLNKLQKDLNNEIKLRIDEVNEITQKIADLNIKIMSAEAAGNTPNDYYDERNALVDRLSTLVKAETYLGPEGNMDIMVGGYYLVSKGKQTRIYAQPSDDLSQFYTPMVEGFDVEIHLGQGLIQGLLEARGQVSGAKGSYDNGTPNTTADVTSVKKQLNALINIMARELNYLHQSGKTLNGADGGLFFEPVNPELPIEMGNLMVASSLKDLNNIVASATDANGDNTIALAIAGLRNANLMTGNGKVLSLDTYYQYIIMDVGNKGQEAANMLESQKKLVQQADQLRQSIMGVSLDEEMTNMIKFKYAYNANSKIINVIDSMLETLIYRLGLAGR